MRNRSDSTIFVADVLLSSATDGDTRVNIGEKSDGEGFGQQTALWGNGDGFVSVPNAPTTDGACQAVYMVDGNVKRVLALRDSRYGANAGSLAAGDRAIVSNSDAYVKLTAGTNTIELVSGGMTIKLDGATNHITIKSTSGKIFVDGDLVVNGHIYAGLIPTPSGFTSATNAVEVSAPSPNTTSLIIKTTDPIPPA